MCPIGAGGVQKGWKSQVGATLLTLSAAWGLCREM